jgi:hypothetical protein
MRGDSLDVISCSPNSNSSMSINNAVANTEVNISGEHVIPVEATRHNVCSVCLRNKKFQPRQCIPPNTIPLTHPVISETIPAR